MPSIDRFGTKRGVARFTDQTVHFEESLVGYARSLYRGYWRSDSWWRKAIFLSYAFLPAVAVGWLASLRSSDVLLAASVAGLLAALWLVNYARGFRSPDRIPLDAIEAISATRGTTGLTRPRLVITYTSDGSTRQRRVFLPSLYTTSGETVYERALEAFERRGFDVE